MTRYGLVMICKDESAVIERTLRSLLPFVGHWTICDTGSSDGTPEIVERVMAGVPGTLHRIEFGNFGRARSEAFALAKGTAQFLIATDADMEWEIDPDFDPTGPDCWMIEMGTGSFSYRLPLLLAGDQDWRSYGAVHEYTALADGSLGRREPTDHVRITHHGEGRSSPEKTKWHLDLLEAAWAENQDPRTAFYLGQTERELGNADRARDWYRLRSMMGGWDEEAAVAARWAALLEPEWPARCAGLIRAWEMRPSRLEPLYALVKELNERDLHRAAYGLSGVPTGPCGDVLFVDRSVWDWGMAFQRSIAAWWVGDFDEFERLTAQLLLTPRLPDYVRTQVMANHALRAA